MDKSEEIKEVMQQKIESNFNNNNNSTVLDVIKLENCNLFNKPKHGISRTERESPLQLNENDKTESKSAREASSKIKKSDINLELLKNASLCTICFSRSSDAILLPCCHGGICYQCGITLSRQDAHCYYCHKSFWQILLIDIRQEQDIDFYRVIDMHNVVQYPCLTANVRSLLYQSNS